MLSQNKSHNFIFMKIISDISDDMFGNIIKYLNFSYKSHLDWANINKIYFKDPTGYVSNLREKMKTWNKSKRVQYYRELINLQNKYGI